MPQTGDILAGLPTSKKESPLFKERRHSEFFDVIGASLAINSPEKFCAWAQGDLQRIFPHGMLICGIGEIEKHNAHIHQLLTCKFPKEYLQAMLHTGGLGVSPVVAQWLKTRRPVLFESSQQQNQTPWLDNFRKYGLQNMAAHGLSDLGGHTTTYFSFSQIPGHLTLRHARLLEMLVPHLHVALIHALRNQKKVTPETAANHTELTGREQEILQWLGSGKTNWEIAQQLNISENTVKNHVQRVLIKLNVKTRAQAVAKALNTKNTLA